MSVGHELKKEIPKERIKGEGESFAEIFLAENASKSTSRFLKIGRSQQVISAHEYLEK